MTTLTITEKELENYQQIRKTTEEICSPLCSEDYNIQGMESVSPPKWHLAHTTWFFETFLLKPYLENYQVFHPKYEYLFNSYYNCLGNYHPRPQRGFLSRPTIDEIYEYRQYVDKHMLRLLENRSEEIQSKTVLGLNHEQQHQELLLTDIKYNFWCHPLLPTYLDAKVDKNVPKHTLDMIYFEGGLTEIGSGQTFSYDNETPRHTVYLQPYSLASRLIICGEYLEFVENGGYDKPEYWLSDGWIEVKNKEWKAPLYWYKQNNQWRIMTLYGPKNLDLGEPVCHVSYYEADAFAKYRKQRLPTEFEWEHAAQNVPIEGNLMETLHPQPSKKRNFLEQFYGDVWEWTSSHYSPYPGYKPLSGKLGEYNGKFMCNQFVLRGGSCATPKDHIRLTYRNFFHANERWQFSGIRLASNE